MERNFFPLDTVKTVASKKVSHPDSGGSEWETEEEVNILNK